VYRRVNVLAVSRVVEGDKVAVTTTEDVSELLGERGVYRRVSLLAVSRVVEGEEVTVTTTEDVSELL